MALIRECQPKTIEDWEKWYFENAFTSGKQQLKITRKSLNELGERLYSKIKTIVIPEWLEAFNQLTKQDCIDYIFNLTINRTFDGFIREKSVVEDNLARRFPEIKFEQSEPEMDHAGDVDYLGWVGNRAFGIQIKPIMAQANFGNYSVSERMRRSFDDFTERFGGKVFVVFSLDGEISNLELLDQMKEEIERLKNR